MEEDEQQYIDDQNQQEMNDILIQAENYYQNMPNMRLNINDPPQQQRNNVNI